VPVVSAEVVVPVSPDAASAVSQTTGATRMRWDPFIREQHPMDGAERPGKGVRTFTRVRQSCSMVSRYVSCAPGSNVGMTMETGPWFFDVSGEGWPFMPHEDGTLARWKYSFSIRPDWLHVVGDPVVLAAVES
jgi:hypothetical protein